MNGDGKADIVCRADDGGIMVFESKDVDNFYEPGTVWSDEIFGFCANNRKWVLLICLPLKGLPVETWNMATRTCPDAFNLHLTKISYTFVEFYDNRLLLLFMSRFNSYCINVSYLSCWGEIKTAFYFPDLPG